MLLQTTTRLLLRVHDFTVSHHNHPNAVDGLAVSESVELHKLEGLVSLRLRFVPPRRQSVVRGSAVGRVRAHRRRVVCLLLQSE